MSSIKDFEILDKIDTTIIERFTKTIDKKE